IAWASLNGLSAWNGALADQLILHDQFGGEYDVADNTDTLVNEEADFLGLQFAISNVKWSGSTQTGTIDIDNNTGVITTGAQGSISSFTIVVTAPSGKTASIDVIINN
ncbi:MAG: hypothetical protein K0Q73_5502, partial [Paenibacillus sp.]|nr:hypothetical protein [Paenibacillus sp.]